jgi:hypothetical protein
MSSRLNDPEIYETLHTNSDVAASFGHCNKRHIFFKNVYYFLSKCKKT